MQRIGGETLDLMEVPTCGLAVTLVQKMVTLVPREQPRQSAQQPFNIFLRILAVCGSKNLIIAMPSAAQLFALNTTLHLSATPHMVVIFRRINIKGKR
jgi:hypothetical protein